MLVYAQALVCERDGCTQRKRETACQLWPATASGELICGKRERERKRETEIEIEIDIESERREREGEHASESTNCHFI